MVFHEHEESIELTSDDAQKPTCPKVHLAQKLSNAQFFRRRSKTKMTNEHHQVRWFREMRRSKQKCQEASFELKNGEKQNFVKE
jgi:hypothetical protein